jgi:DNA-binding IclR family transcriptional regulator
VRSLQLKDFTSNTLCTEDALLAELKQVAKNGYAFDREEWFIGMVAMAVPILDERRRYVASLAFHGPVQRLTYEDAWSKRQVLIDGARLMRDVLFEQSTGSVAQVTSTRPRSA